VGPDAGRDARIGIEMPDFGGDEQLAALRASRNRHRYRPLLRVEKCGRAGAPPQITPEAPFMQAPEDLRRAFRARVLRARPALADGAVLDDLFAP
jgi:hypothetical protein